MERVVHSRLEMATARKNPRSLPPTLVLLVRHGVTATTGRVLPGRRAGLHLSDEGVKQAEHAARRIATLERVAAVYSSPLERARETARPIARARRLPVRIERGLLEVDIGQWAGRKLDELRKRPEWDVVQRHPSAFRFPGGESFSEMQARMAGTLARLVAQNPGRVIVAVSHADPIKAAVAHALGVPLDLFQRIVIGTASITAIAYGRTNATVLTVNSSGGDLAAVLG
jgi:probable phosphomutase (TIGR03848 family)